MAGMGTGTPQWFRCWNCRRTDDWRNHDDRGWINRVKLTGLTRENRNHRRTQRTSGLERQYECMDCGHVGWSSHVDLERKK